MCSLIHSVQQRHRCWLVILNVSPHMFYATEVPDLRVKGHVVGFEGPLCFCFFSLCSEDDTRGFVGVRHQL